MPMYFTPPAAWLAEKPRRASGVQAFEAQPQAYSFPAITTTFPD
jgi:hypothetical protein